MKKPTCVLLIEDSTPDARYVQEMLSGDLYNLVHKTSLGQIHDCIPENFDVILLDLSLPDASGLESFLAMHEWAKCIPIVIVTGLDDESIAAQAVHLGAQDYIMKKEISERRLSRTIRYAIERKQFEENTKRLAMFERQEEFMATLTHDLKNPLIGANRVLELMAAQAMGSVTAEQSRVLFQLRDSNKVLLSMIQNLIEVYRFEKDVDTVVLENTNLVNIITSCINEIAPIAQDREILLKFEVPEQIKEVKADANSLHRVMQNLLGNALKFTPDGGQIRAVLYTTNGSVVIEITDTGSGIPADEQSRLFQRFSQGRSGKKYTPGTGLGLYLCKQIIDLHRGKIVCKSEVGIGSTFVVTLPVA